MNLFLHNSNLLIIDSIKKYIDNYKLDDTFHTEVIIVSKEVNIEDNANNNDQLEIYESIIE